MKLVNYKGNSEKSGIYCIKNLINSKLYIGSSKVGVGHRKRSHLSHLTNNTHYNEHLQNAWNKYGEENFSFEILLLCPSNECEKYEAEFIKIFNSNDKKFGYNIASVKEYKFKYKISESHLKETSERKKEKAFRVSGHDSEEIGLNKAVTLYNLNGELIKEYPSCKLLSEDTHLSRPHISNILNKRKLVYNEYVILYYNDVLTESDLLYIKKRTERVKVDIYTLEYTLIKSGVLIKDATDFLNCQDAEIRMCYTNKRNRIKNFIITRYEQFPKKCVLKTTYQFCKIEQIDKSGQVIRLWDNIKQITKENIEYKEKYILRILNGSRKYYMDYNWKIYESSKEV